MSILDPEDDGLKIQPPAAPAPPPDLDAAWKGWKAAPSTAANAQLLTAMDPVIDRAVKLHVGDPNPLVKGRARRLALQAAATYDPKRGRLQSHLFNQLRGLKRYAAQASNPVRVPERLLLDRRAALAAAADLADELGREPTDLELADRTGLSTARIARARRYATPMTEGYFASLGERGGEGFTPAVRGSESDAWLRAVYADLPAMDQKILEWSLDWNGQPQLPNQEIARRLRRSPGAISQRKAAIQALLDQEGLLSPFGGG